MASPLAHLRKIGSVAAVRARVRRARARGEKIVFTNGCFDLLHPGHVRYLAAARTRGDVLVVGLNSDRSVRALKGQGRPIQSAEARAEVLAGLSSVDHVVVFDAPTPLELILALRPDVLAKGADWAADAIIGADEVRSWGGRVERIRLVEGQSTTRLVQRSSRTGGRPQPAAGRRSGPAAKR